MNINSGESSPVPEFSSSELNFGEGMISSRLKLLCVSLAALPPLIHAAFVLRFAHQVPIWEQWYFVGIFERFHSGGDWISFLLTPYNDHIHSFPLLISFVLGLMTQWNILFEIYLGFFVLLGCFGILVMWLSRLSPRLFFPFLPVISIFWFSLRAFEVSLNGFDTTVYYISALLILATIEFLYRSRWSNLSFVLGVATAVLLNFSWGGGQLVWPAGLLLVLGVQVRQRRYLLLMFWMIAALVTWGVTSMFHSMPDLLAGLDVFSVMWFSASLVGTPMTEEVSWIFALVILLGLLGMISLWYRIRWNPLTTPVAPWVGFGVYSLLNIPAIALARSFEGLEFSTLSRYCFIVTPFILSFFVLLVVSSGLDFRGRWPSRKRVLMITAGLAIVFSAFSVLGSLRSWRLIDQFAAISRPLGTEAKERPNLLSCGQFLGIVSNNPEAVSAGLRIMKTYGLALFRHGPNIDTEQLDNLLSSHSTRNPSRLKCEISNGRYVRESRSYSFSGRVVDQDTGNSPFCIFVPGNDQEREFGILGYPGSMDESLSDQLGFVLQIQEESIPKNESSLELTILATDGLRNTVPLYFVRPFQGVKQPLFRDDFEGGTLASWGADRYSVGHLKREE